MADGAQDYFCDKLFHMAFSDCDALSQRAGGTFVAKAGNKLRLRAEPEAVSP